MATTVTPGRMAPLVSATMPLICAVACAHTFEADRSRRTTPTKVPQLRFIHCLRKRRGSRIRRDDDCRPTGAIKVAGKIKPPKAPPVFSPPPDEGAIREPIPARMNTDKHQRRERG